MKDSATTSFPVSRILTQEPLVHFLGLAALLFIANAFFSPDNREVIAVDVATQEFLIEQRQSLMLRDLSETEKQEAVETFIEEEILVREARKRGLENNSRIRALLIQNMRFFMASTIPDPTEEDLRTYFDSNIERFTSEPSVTYHHVYFADPDSVPANTLSELESGAEYSRMGDTTYQNAVLSRMVEGQIVSNFNRDIARTILDIDDNKWHGPFVSQTGAHFLRIVERHPRVRPNYESAQSWLEEDWFMTKRDEIVERELMAMREDYRIEIAVPGDDSE